MLTATVAALSQALSFGVSGLLHSPSRDAVQLVHRAAVPLSFGAVVAVSAGSLRVDLRALSWNAEQVLIEYRAVGAWTKSPYSGNFWASRRTVTQFAAGHASDGTSFLLTLTPLGHSADAAPRPEMPPFPGAKEPGAQPPAGALPTPRKKEQRPTTPRGVTRGPRLPA